MDNELLKDLTFYKAVATAFANEPSIPQSVKDGIIMLAIQRINEDERPPNLSDEEVKLAVSGETSRKRSVKLEEFRLLLIDKKEAGNEMLDLYEKYNESHDKNSNTEEKLYKLIHWAISKAEGVYIISEDAPLQFDADYLLPFLRKLSRSKKVKTSATLVVGTYYEENHNPDCLWVNIRQQSVFSTIESLDNFIKKQKGFIAVSSVYKNDGGVVIEYEPLPEPKSE